MKSRQKKSVVCANCNTVFDKEVREIRRTVLRGGKHFCSLRCSGFYTARRRLGKSVGFGAYVCMIRQRAKKRGLAFDLDAAYLADMFDKQSGRCAVSGLKLTLNQYRGGYPIHGKYPTQASLDRIDNTRGYVVGNVQFVCLAVNYMRNTFSISQLNDFIAQLRD